MDIFIASSGCRLTSSSRSTRSRPPSAPRASTSSISAWAIPICRRRGTSSRSWSRPPASRAPTAIPPPRASAACAAPRPHYYERRFGVKLNPDTQVVATLGSKEGFANMAQAITGARRRRAGAQSELSDPRLRLPDGGRRHPLGAGRADAGVLPGARAGDDPFGAQADRARHLLSGQPDRLSPPIARFLPRPRRLREEARADPALGSRLCRGLFRRERPAALDAAGAGRDRRHRRVHLDVEDLLDGRLAHGLRGRQRAPAGGAGAGEILSRLRRLHADPGRGRRGAERPRRLHPRDARDLSQAPRRAGRELRQGRLGYSRRRRPRCSPGCRSPRNSAISARWSSRSC